ncbi:hypothetical protein [Desertivirga brevis]|uniref:hypothetical protein n=1 Tax=Desertivirga brevis TaxID=2810310 RepID=UPI001A975DA0|nr:hypothetical protein [Pedobacter sp. SYSU D00873]
MEFSIKLDSKEYHIEPVGNGKVTYKVTDGNGSYNLKLDSGGEWICDCDQYGTHPIPVEEIGKEIEKYFE